MALAVNSVVSYSARPLVYISYFGLAVTLVAMLYVAWVVVRQLLYNVAPSRLGLFRGLHLAGRRLDSDEPGRYRHLHFQDLQGNQA